MFLILGVQREFHFILCISQFAICSQIFLICYEFSNIIWRLYSYKDYKYIGSTYNVNQQYFYNLHSGSICIFLLVWLFLHTIKCQHNFGKGLRFILKYEPKPKEFEYSEDEELLMKDDEYLPDDDNFFYLILQYYFEFFTNLIKKN
ncbi:hypothetical protein C2G38_1632542 [Gigaspora rosea]|uniref:Transmembrane protein n=1 Tax=Gigaspora rosea TaxID=44941 RepID=A0A397UYR5_9GLOM|nr:hypothetical protein C2G38_1632542 [Gigaspora rosea]